MVESRTPSPLLAPLGRLLEEALNQVLALDPQAANVLAPLTGRAIEIRWSGPNLALRATVENGRLRIGPALDSKPDLSLAGPLAGLIKLAFPERAGALPAGKVEMSGDAELAREVARLAGKFSPDFDAPFVRALGPAAGTLVARGLREGLALVRDSGAALARDAALYVREEARDGIAREELSDFLDAVDKLRDDVERMAARVAALGRQDAAR
jgi:ubiquinone biosynthesis protein UbiJ